MSKKCCGIIYSDEDEVCKICGKTLVSEENVHDEKEELNIDEITAMVDKIAQDVKGVSAESEEEKTEATEDMKAAEDLKATEDLKVAEDLKTTKDMKVAEDSKEALSDEKIDEEKALNENNTDKKNSVKDEQKEIFIEEEEPVVIKEKKKKKDKKEIPDGEKASKGLKIAGIMFLALAIVGLALVGICVYFMAFNPYYDKSKENYKLDYPYVSSSTDAYEMSEMLELMTDTDASPSDATATDAKEGE